ERFVTTPATTQVDENGYFVESKSEARIHGQPGTVSTDMIDLMDVSSKQIFSLATSLIPFVEHDDANRALMGTNMQRQAVSLIKPQSPVVGTGVEGVAARYSGQLVTTDIDGEVMEVHGDR